jgi:hypothetical protein
VNPGRAYLTGVIEGFYGQPWTWAQRQGWVDWLHALGLNTFLYAPKADPWLRRRWQEHWPAADWAELRALSRRCRERGVAFCPGLSPFRLYSDYGESARRRLRHKIERLNELRAPLLALLFDDMPGDQSDLAARQGDIVADVLRWSDTRRLLVCPTYYSSDPVLERAFGTRPARYWRTLGEALPAAVDIFWTGSRVCADAIGVSDVTAIGRLLGRPVTLWDNWPVNDGARRSQHLFLTPPPARDPGLRRHCRGHLCNGMNQPWLSLPALAGLAQHYGSIRCAPQWLAAHLGPATAGALAEDAALFAGTPRDELDAGERRRLRARYGSLPGPAAAELRAWLDGAWTFDPACLTD